jgi:multidrug resistance efflux pump
MNDKTKSDKTRTEKTEPGKDPVRKWTKIVLGASVLLMLLYVLADRVTPYTSQARVNALVVPITAEVSGTVTDVAVSSNQAVSAGDLLFQIEQERYELAVETAEAGLETARQSTRSSTANVDAAAAKLEIARAGLVSATQDATRLRRIKQEDDGAISDRRIEMSESSLASATGNVAAAESALLAAEEALGETGDDNTMVLQAQAALDQARLNLSYTRVQAPLDGIVTDVRVDRGSFIAAGKAQMTFVATQDVWIQADFTENNLGNIKNGDEVDILFDALPGQIVKGRVRTTGFGVKVDSATLGSLPTIQNDRAWLRDAQRFRVLVDFELPDASDRQGLRVGAQASVVVYTGNNFVMNGLAWLKMRLQSVLTYLY